ncbi:hypothetical protein BN440_0939 [Erwinia amylovora MR1]|nr:hypothetical protein BN440_0939 [Erwinia amylovora MR1]
MQLVTVLNWFAGYLFYIQASLRKVVLTYNNAVILISPYFGNVYEIDRK